MKRTMFKISFGEKGKNRYIAAFNEEEAVIVAQADQIKDGLQYKEYTVEVIE